MSAVELGRMVNTLALVHRRLDGPAAVEPAVDIVVPVYNEAPTLGINITRLHSYLSSQFPFSWRITIADNASTDGTWAEATGRAVDARCVRCGWKATRWSSRTWTSTSRLISTRSCRSWRPWYRVTPTCRLARTCTTLPSAAWH